LLIRYFSIFKHPLKLDEICRYASTDSPEAAIEDTLLELEQEGRVRKLGDFYLFQNEENCIAKRLAGEQKATELLPQAKKTARFIGRFPFVRFVGISGSLSKGYADENSDFDFFIITASNTLWICRTLLHLFKKMTFLTRRQHHFCMNYFVDEDHLSLEEKNIFTRIELSTLIAVYNKPMYHLLLYKNQDKLPNLGRLPYNEQEAFQLLERRRNRKHVDSKLIIALNHFLMKLTDYKWRRKWKRKNYPMEDYSLAFKTTPYVSKNHPKNYQKKVMTHLNHISS
jgi:hypothetical protein